MGRRRKVEWSNIQMVNWTRPSVIYLASKDQKGRFFVTSGFYETRDIERLAAAMALHAPNDFHKESEQLGVKPALAPGSVLRILGALNFAGAVAIPLWLVCPGIAAGCSLFSVFAAGAGTYAAIRLRSSRVLYMALVAWLVMSAHAFLIWRTIENQG